MFAIQFSLNEKYPETIKLVENYLIHFIEMYQSQKIKYKSIERCCENLRLEDNAYFKSRKKEKKLIMQREIKYSQLSNKVDNYKTSLEIENEINQFKHVGLSANHQHNQYIKIDNNAILNQKIASPYIGKLKSKSLDNKKFQRQLGFNFQKDEIKGEESNYKKIPILFRTYKKVDRGMNQQFKIMQMNRKQSLSMINQNDAPNIYLNQTDHIEEDNQKKIKRDSSELQDTMTSFNQFEVRKFLHPSLSQDSLCDKYTIQGPEVFQKLSDPYVTQQEIQRFYQKEQDKKIIGSKRFYTYISKQNSQNQSQQSSYSQQNTSQTFYNKVCGGAQKIQQFNVKNMVHQKWISVGKEYKL